MAMPARLNHSPSDSERRLLESLLHAGLAQKSELGRLEEEARIAAENALIALQNASDMVRLTQEIFQTRCRQATDLMRSIEAKHILHPVRRLPMDILHEILLAWSDVSWGEDADAHYGAVFVPQPAHHVQMPYASCNTCL